MSHTNSSQIQSDAQERQIERQLSRPAMVISLVLSLAIVAVVVSAVIGGDPDSSWRFALQVVGLTILALSFIGHRLGHKMWSVIGLAFGVTIFIFAGF